MNLHRANKEADWAHLPSENMSGFQRIAAKTGGIITPANVLDTACLGLFFSGLKDVYQGRTLKGIAKIGVARIGDMADGALAEATKTKSPLGEAIDVVIDKVEIAAAVPILAKRGLIPRRAAAIIIAQNVANTAVTMLAKYRGVEIHSSENGKHNTFGQSLSLGVYSLSAAAEQMGAPLVAQGLEQAGDASLFVTADRGIKALVGYTHDAFAPLPETLDS